MTEELTFPFEPMEAKIAGELPVGPEWEYEPKWDGFRCVAIKNEAGVELQSKSSQSLTRYFPEVVDALEKLKAQRFAVDGELVVPVAGRLSFDDLLQRVHPAESRVKLLSRETPARFVLFDLLEDEKEGAVLERPFHERRAMLEKFHAKFAVHDERIALTVATRDAGEARKWLVEMRGQLDGIVAKKIDDPYLPGERAMIKFKTIRSADCVVGGFRYGSAARVVGSLLLGLYDREGRLNHVGFTSGLAAAAKKSLTAELEGLVAKPGFDGRSPGGPSRWSTARSAEWEPLRPKLVVEIQYDHFTGERFRHGTRLLRWRPDKDPRQCTMEQVAFESKTQIDLLLV
jgi:ATP-dependent DNA ligase